MAKNSKGVQQWIDDVFNDKKVVKKSAKTPKTTDLHDDWDWDNKPTTIKRDTKKVTKKVAKKASKKSKAVKGVDYKDKYKRLLVSCKKLAKSVCKLAKELKALR